MRRLPTRLLLYHCVGPSSNLHPDPTPAELGMITPSEVLERHITLLLELGYRFVTAGELAGLWRDKVPPQGLAVLTFDDGWCDGLTTVAPLLKRLGLRATFYLCPGLFGETFWRWGELGVVMSEPQARELHAAGMELGAHTLAHPDDPSALTDEELRREYAGSRDAVEAITGEPCLTFAYPSGNHDPRARRAAADAGYRLALAARPGPWERLAAPRWTPGITGSEDELARRLSLSHLLAVGAVAPPFSGDA